MARVIAALLVLLGGEGCGDDSAAKDAAVSADGGPSTDAVVQLVSPDAPAPPELTPCPDGWSEVVGDGPASCEPWPDDRGGCAPDEAHFPGRPGCEQLGSLCPADGWPTGLPTDRPVLHALATAAAGGDGSRGAPFSDVQTALVGAPVGAVVAVARGTYDGLVEPVRPATVWGACVAETTLTDSAGVAQALANVLDTELELRNLTVAQSTTFGVLSGLAGGSVRLTDVVVTGSSTAGVAAAQGASLTATRVVVRDTRAAPDSTAGRGIVAQTDSVLDLTSVVVDANRDFGVFVVDNSQLNATSLAIRATDYDLETLTTGAGLLINAATEATVTSSVLEGNRSSAAVFADESTHARLADVVVRGTRPSFADMSEGRGPNVLLGASLELERVLVADNHDLGIFANDAGTSLVARDVVVRDTASQRSDLGAGRGLHVQRSATARVERATFTRSREVGISIQTGSTATLTDCSVRDTRSREGDGRMGQAVGAQLLARLDALRIDVDGSETGGIIGSQDSDLNLMHAAIRNVARNECPAASCPNQVGYGLIAVTAAKMTVQQFELTGAEICGAFIDDRGGSDVALDLMNGTVSGSEIGACIQVDEYDLTRLTDGVRYIDNGVNLQATSLPVPETVADF